MEKLKFIRKYRQSPSVPNRERYFRSPSKASSLSKFKVDDVRNEIGKKATTRTFNPKQSGNRWKMLITWVSAVKKSFTNRFRNYRDQQPVVLRKLWMFHDYRDCRFASTFCKRQLADHLTEKGLFAIRIKYWIGTDMVDEFHQRFTSQMLTEAANGHWLGRIVCVDFNRAKRRVSESITLSRLSCWEQNLLWCVWLPSRFMALSWEV